MEEIGLEYKVLGKGETTLVIELGIGGSFYNWHTFVQQIKKDFTVVMYHRSGYGKSGSSDNPRTVEHIAKELDGLIEKLHINDKFVLIGHSFGGLCAQQYAKMYPKKLKGVMLIDSTSHNFQQLYNLDLPVMYSKISLEQMVEGNRKTASKSKEELKHLFKDMIQEYNKLLPENEANKFNDFISRPYLFQTIAEEFDNWERSSGIIKESGEFPNIPLTVIARDKKLSAKPFIEHGIPEQEAYLHEGTWRKLQIELSKMSSDGKFIIADHSDHEIHKDRPDVIIQSLERFR